VLPSGAKAFELNAAGEVSEQHRTQEDLRAHVLFTLPPATMAYHPGLLGAFDFDGDGTEEIFLKWVKTETLHQPQPPDTYQIYRSYHYQIYRKGDAGYGLMGDFELPDEADATLRAQHLAQGNVTNQ